MAVATLILSLSNTAKGWLKAFSFVRRTRHWVAMAPPFATSPARASRRPARSGSRTSSRSHATSSTPSSSSAPLPGVSAHGQARAENLLDDTALFTQRGRVQREYMRGIKASIGLSFAY
jgi:hypothetical protein